DSDPNGTKLHVAPDLVPPLVEAKDGQAFVSQNTVRFKASDKPGTVYLTYEAVNASGQKDAGYVTIQVTAPDAKTNSAPLARDLTGRVLSASKTRISVPLDGIDPDGDSVQLVGLASAPQKGRVDVGADYLDYQAIGDATGTDTFTYRVRDRLGAESTATVRVGIAPASTTNQSPYAVKDSVVMRPGRQVAVPVLTNDSDPDGDAFGLVANGLTVPDVAGLSAKVVGDRVEVTAPDRPTETSLQYTIRDERGASATGVLQISVADDVPLMTPIARDDVVRAEDIKDDVATVDVLDNDEDPDGTTGALTVTVDGDAATVGQGGRLHIPITDRDQLIMYTITDQDSLAASAFVHVPSLTSLPPSLISTKGVTVKSGQTVELPLRDYVRVAHGQGAVITEHEKVSALHGNGDDLVKDRSTLVYTSADRYFGPDAITFEVTDGTGPDDPAGNKATLVLPITVTPPDNQPPVFTNGQVEVAPGEDAASLDLRALTRDPDLGDLDGVTYRVSGGTAGMTARVDGQTLQVSADASTPKGTVGHFTIELTDGHTAPVTGTVDARVTASTRELAVATDDVIDQADQGKTVRVDVLGNDVNPFAADGRPLKIVAATTEAGDAAVEIAGDHLQITPASSFVGRAVVRYRVQDATGDPDREVEGHVLMTVQGVPAAPGTPTVSSVQDRTVVLSWSPPIDNGAPITKYTVTAVGGGYTKVCEATTCTLDGLTNNVVYSFRVVATNRVGDSPASPASAEARPDARPDTPQPPTLDYGDRSLKVAWATPPTPGSPVQSYNLEISPAPPSGIASKSKVTGNALTWDGLENGVAYQVRVQAVNLAPEPSSWSGWSASEIPARAPGAPGTPTTSMLQPVGSQAQMKVSWTAAAANGDAVSEYELSVMRGSSTLRTISVAGGATSQAVVVDASTTDYTYKVRARNKAGWGTYSSVSAPRRGVVAPGAPGTPTGTPGDKKIAVTYTAAAGNGALSSEIRYQYSLNGGAWQGSWSGTSNTITGLTNGTTYKIRVRAVSTVDGAAYTGPTSASSAGYVPFGAPGTPGATAKASGTNITFTWSAPSANGAAIDQTQVRYDGGTWQTVAGSGSATKSYGYSTTHKIEVRAHNKAGWGSIGSASATTAAQPKPKATAKTVPGGSVYKPGECTTSTCAYVAVKTENFPAGNYTITIRTSLGDSRTYSGFHLPANGTTNTSFFFGYPGETVQVQIVGWGYADAVSWY
uniref:Ig-like domain-containing protein n=1 Tax=Microbacterium sp. TaxID=51671 RepID=UPI003A928E0C